VKPLSIQIDVVAAAGAAMPAKPPSFCRRV
jgi:hypothetical protein